MLSHTRTHAHTHTHARTHMLSRTRTHARTHTHTHTQTLQIKHYWWWVGRTRRNETTDQYSQERRSVLSFDFKAENEDECFTQREREFQTTGSELFCCCRGVVVMTNDWTNTKKFSSCLYLATVTLVCIVWLISLTSSGGEQRHVVWKWRNGTYWRKLFTLAL